MFERPTAGDALYLIHTKQGTLTDQGKQQEFHDLALSTGGVIVGEMVVNLRSLHANTLIGKGKLTEVTACLKTLNAQLVIVDYPLTPAQERNLEKIFSCRVMDRRGLILDIFASRARTHEGQLQVELAQMRYLSTRLVRGWTHLERQKGGIGLRGPGEKQLELDKRMIAVRVKAISDQLEKVKKRRTQSRAFREKSGVPTIALIGYTNAGKSSLFNMLTHAGVYEQDQLFATLDPTMRAIVVPALGRVIVTDTVGFIRELPHDLVEAFRATLEETVHADVLIHVVDIHHPDYVLQMEQVHHVLQELGIDNKPILLVFNKIDLTEDSTVRDTVDESTGLTTQLWMSAKAGSGIDVLKKALSGYLMQTRLNGTIVLESGQGKLRSELYACGAVLAETLLESGGWQIKIDISKPVLSQMCRHAKVSLDQILRGERE